MAPDGPEVVLDAVSGGKTTTSPPVADFRTAGSFLVEDAVAAVLSRVGFTVVGLAVPMSPVAAAAAGVALPVMAAGGGVGAPKTRSEGVNWVSARSRRRASRYILVAAERDFSKRSRPCSWSLAN